MSHEEKKLWVEWTFAGFWVVLFFVGWAIASRTSRYPKQTFRAFVPVLGLVTVLLLVGTIVIGGAYYPQ